MLFIEPKTKKKYIKGYGFSSFVRNLFKKYGQLLDTAKKSGINASKKSTSKSTWSNRWI